MIFPIDTRDLRRLVQDWKDEHSGGSDQKAASLAEHVLELLDLHDVAGELETHRNAAERRCITERTR